MKRALFALPLLLATVPAHAQVLGSDASACTSQSTPAIQVSVQGLKDRKGRLKLELYPATEADFLKDDRDLIAAGKPFRRVWVSSIPQSGPVTMCIRAPSAGRWAIFFTHDRDGKNKFNFWSDGAGVVSNRRLKRAKPELVDSVVTVGGGVTNLTIRAQYLRGLSGFAPYEG